MKRALSGMLALLLLLGSSSCWPHRKKPPLPPTQIPSARPAETKPPVATPLPPKVQTSAPPSQTPGPPGVETQPKIDTPPPAPVKKKRRGGKKRTGAPEQAEQPAPAEAAPAEPAPRLGEILSSEQSREYTRALDQSVALVQRVLSTIASRRLTPDQKQTSDRVRVFARQAEEARLKDLATAVNLAKRAELLAQDLLRQLQ